MAATGAETSERLSELTSTRDQAVATLAANTAAVDAAETQIAATTAQIAQARAQLEAAEASARQAHLDLQDTVVRSVLAGKVGDRSVRVGQYVQPGTRMLSVVPVQSTYLTANFNETQVAHMRVGRNLRNGIGTNHRWVTARSVFRHVIGPPMPLGTEGPNEIHPKPIWFFGDDLPDAVRVLLDMNYAGGNEVFFYRRESAIDALAVTLTEMREGWSILEDTQHNVG